MGQELGVQSRTVHGEYSSTFCDTYTDASHRARNSVAKASTWHSALLSDHSAVSQKVAGESSYIDIHFNLSPNL